MANNLHIVTVATETKLYFPYLVDSCKRNGKELEVLGYGEEWKGFNHKFILMINYLKTLPSDHIVCFIDGYDVLCTRNLNELVPEFLKIKTKTNCKIIVGSDQHYTFLKYWHNLTYGSCKNKFLNSGNYIGYVKDLLYILNTIYNNNPNETNDDQVLLTEYCINNPTNFYIDTTCELFLVYMNPFTEARDDIVIKNDKVFYHNQRPFFVHTPGGFLDKLIIDLGYNYDYNNNIQDEVRKKVYNFSIFNQIKNGLYILIPMLIFIVIIIYIVYVNKSYIVNEIVKMKKFIRNKII